MAYSQVARTMSKDDSQALRYPHLQIMTHVKMNAKLHAESIEAAWWP